MMVILKKRAPKTDHLAKMLAGIVDMGAPCCNFENGHTGSCSDEVDTLLGDGDNYSS